MLTQAVNHCHRGLEKLLSLCRTKEYMSRMSSIKV